MELNGPDRSQMKAPSPVAPQEKPLTEMCPGEGARAACKASPALPTNPKLKTCEFASGQVEGLLDILPEFVIRYDRQLRRLFVNAAWERMSGQCRSEVLLRPAGDARSRAPAPPQYLKQLMDVRKSGLSQTATFTWTNARGERLMLAFMLIPEFDDGGEVEGILAIGHEISGRSQNRDLDMSTQRKFAVYRECAKALREVNNEDELVRSFCSNIGETFGFSVVASFFTGDREANQTLPSSSWIAEASAERSHLLLKDARDRGVICLSERMKGCRIGRRGPYESGTFRSWQSTRDQKGPQVSICLPLLDTSRVSFGCIVSILEGASYLSKDDVDIMADLVSLLSTGIKATRADGIGAPRGSASNTMSPRKFHAATDLKSAILREAAPPPKDRIHRDNDPWLSERKKQIVQLVVDGAPTKAIAVDLDLSEETVKSHLSAIYRHFGATGRVDLVRRVLEGDIDID